KLAGRMGKFVTVEDHNILGGLGGAVAEVLTKTKPSQLLKIGVQDVYAESGSPEALYVKYKLDTPGITQQIQAFLNF
ncbi:MAG TPA: transketolase C-terminal domain-containing protein, partial [Bdellovibrionota bacterium]|nr:transketolase C-terminal domain-containing protein [Bdellovibrionota bacterium]